MMLITVNLHNNSSLSGRKFETNRLLAFSEVTPNLLWKCTEITLKFGFKQVLMFSAMLIETTVHLVQSRSKTTSESN